MKKSHRFLLVLGYVLTFGVLYLIMRRMAKERAKTRNQELIASDKIPFAPERFVKALGSIENVAAVSSTLSAIKVTVKDKALFDEASLKALKPKGYMWNADNVLTIVFGDFAGALESAIRRML